MYMVSSVESERGGGGGKVRHKHARAIVLKRECFCAFPVRLVYDS